MRLVSLITILVFGFNICFGQTDLTAEELLQKSIQYHDPQNKLFVSDLTLDLLETRPNGKDRSTALKCNIYKESFTYLQERDTLFIDAHYKQGQFNFRVNGNSEISDQVRKDQRLTTERFLMLKNYYQYLWLLPTKLNDRGTIIDPEVRAENFFGKDALEIKVTYEPTVGKDIWYFYFHPSSYALVGYRFYHDEAANDGEYILLEGEMVSENVRLPKERKWYTHKEDKFLGADILKGFWVE